MSIGKIERFVPQHGEVETFDPPRPHLDSRAKIQGFIACINYGYSHGAIKAERAVEMLQMATDAVMEMKR